MSTEKYYVGIDLGGMSAKGGLFSPEGKMVAKSTVKTCKEEGFAVTAKNLAGLAREVCELAKVPLSQLGGVGVGTPASLTAQTGSSLHGQILIGKTSLWLLRCPKISAGSP